ncbi:glycosyltransferase involved in cell wall biosynthesis [Prauserella sediminis]|uniref:Glycosyltransferase involved in cell wall biosynthesis n=1 Tax=Prauserella sediminis TaxID=577680 RepID=A0A839XGL7_9PSEU|nr:glycosyltransferase family 1 protein [Prauserella sediminis]MBB3661901.1 glycosyltransferase involved in cell wall biosynthesis [Prauserella sediminis]
MRELTVVAEQMLAPVPGGTGRYTAELLRALAETTPDGWRVGGVVARHRDVEAARVAGVAGPRVLPVSRRVLTELWRRGIPWWPGGDAVHAPTPLAPPRAPRGRTLSVTVHDTVPWTHPETLTPRGVSWHRAAITTALRRADAVAVPTRAVADDLARHVSGPAPVHVVGHGTTTWPEPAQPEPARPASTRPASAEPALAEPALADRVSADPVSTGSEPAGSAPRPAGLPERYVLAVGTVEPRKGIDVLIRAMTGVGDAALVLAGQPGWGGLDPRRVAADAGLPPERMRVLGRLTDAELITVLRGASALAAPSLAEGFGLPVLEAMAEGVPVVHSDAPALVEVAGGAGRCVRRGDADALAAALREVLVGGEHARTLVRAGRTRARAFTWRAAAQAIWRLHTASRDELTATADA